MIKISIAALLFLAASVGVAYSNDAACNALNYKTEVQFSTAHSDEVILTDKMAAASPEAKALIGSLEARFPKVPWTFDSVLVYVGKAKATDHVLVFSYTGCVLGQIYLNSEQSADVIGQQI